MRRALGVLILFSVAACCIRYPDVPIDLGGSIDIAVAGLPEIRGVFSIESAAERFTVFFLDEFHIPRGSVTVDMGVVDAENLILNGETAGLFRFWAFIFGGGRKAGDISFRGVIVEYDNWHEIDGEWFPRFVAVESEDIRMEMRITYGTPGPG